MKRSSCRFPSIRRKKAIYLGAAVLLVLMHLALKSGCHNSNPSDSKAPEASNVIRSYVTQKKILPPEVHELFYAVKDSLDYAAVTGGTEGPLSDIPEDPPAEKSLDDFERVTPELLENFEQKFSIESYTAEGWNYELIVFRRSHPNEKYKATRKKIYRLAAGQWESLGAYMHW